MFSDERRLRVGIVVLALAGIGISTYLTIVDFAGAEPVCAAGGKGCKTVANSPYSHLLGVPVSLFGVGGYLAILVSALLPGDGARLAGFMLALVGVGFSAYLTYLELFVIHAICQWCVASAVVMTALVGLTAVRVLRAGPANGGLVDGEPAEARPLDARPGSDGPAEGG